MLEGHEGTEAFPKFSRGGLRVATPGALKGEDCAGVRAAQASRIAYRWEEQPGRRERWAGGAEGMRMSVQAVIERCGRSRRWWMGRPPARVGVGGGGRQRNWGGEARGSWALSKMFRVQQTIGVGRQVVRGIQAAVVQMIANGPGHEQGRVMPLVALCLCTLHERSLDLCHRDRPEQTRRGAADRRAQALDTLAMGMGMEARRVSTARAKVAGEEGCGGQRWSREERRPRPGRCDATDQPSRSSKTWQQG